MPLIAVLEGGKEIQWNKRQYDQDEYNEHRLQINGRDRYSRAKDMQTKSQSWPTSLDRKDTVI